MAADYGQGTTRLYRLDEISRPNLAFIVVIFAALFAFEFFNFSTTHHALTDMLGPLAFLGVPWAIALAVAFCAIDFAGIARLFIPNDGQEEPKEVWYLFGAWLLAATMNAILTWWGVSIAIANRPADPKGVIDPVMMATVIPVFVAVMVWVIRILIIGSLSLSIDRILRYIPVADVPVTSRLGAYRQGDFSNTNAFLRSGRTHSTTHATRPRFTQPEPTYDESPAYLEEESTSTQPRRGKTGFHPINTSPRRK
jgi:hypothetical protein